MAALLLAVFLGMLDAQIVATALPRIVSDLGGLSEFAWVTTAYIIASSVSTPVYGKLGDLLGRKNVFLTAIFFFLAGSVASGLAQSIGQLIAFRVVQGIGAGGLFVSVFAIIGEMFSPREGARYYGYFSMVFAVSALAGPAVGGALTDWLSWPAVFFINVPFALLALLAVGLFLRLPSHPRRPHIDYAGIALLTGASSASPWPPVGAGSDTPGPPRPSSTAWAWRRSCSPCCSSWLNAGVSESVIPLRLFRNSTLTLAVLIGALAGAVFLGSVNFLALFVQVVTGATPTQSGLILLPMMLGLLASSNLSSKYIARSGRYKWYPVASMSLGIVAVLQLSTMDADTPRRRDRLHDPAGRRGRLQHPGAGDGRAECGAQAGLEPSRPPCRSSGPSVPRSGSRCSPRSSTAGWRRRWPGTFPWTRTCPWARPPPRRCSGSCPPWCATGSPRRTPTRWRRSSSPPCRCWSSAWGWR